MKNDSRNLNLSLIIDESAKLFFTNGYKNTSLQQVADNLNVTRPAIYHYFKSKEQIILAIFEEVISKTEEYFSEILLKQEPVYIKFENMIEKHILLILENQIKIGIFFEEQKSLPVEAIKRTKEVIDLYYNTAIKWFEEGVKNQYFIDVDSGVAVHTILGSCNWAYKWFSHEGRLSKEEVAAMMCNLLLKGYKK